jgi:hypothetical protein
VYFRAALFIVIAAAALSSAAAAISEDAFDQSRKTTPSARSTTTNPSSQGRMLGHLLAAFRNRVVSGRVVAAGGRRRVVWVHYDLRGASAVEQVRGRWQAIVATGLLRAVSRSRGWRPVVGHRFYVVRNGRRRFDSESVVGNAFRGAIRHATEAETMRLLRTSSAQVGVALASVQLVRPLGRPAVEVVVEAPDPRAFAANAAERIWNLALPLNHGSRTPRAEGVYVVVRAPDRTWVAASGYGVRTAAGSSTINPAFQ